MLANFPVYKPNFTSYYHPKQEISSLVPYRKLNHYSYFFRDYRGAFASDFLERLPFDGKNKLEVTSLGCSYGQEVYSFAMKFAQRGLKDKVKLTGYDLSQIAVDYAKGGVYDFYEEVLDNPQVLKNGRCGEYFIPQTDKSLKIATELLPECDFKKADIRNLELPKESQDMVLFNNVLYHITENLSEEEQQKVCDSMAKLIYDAMKIDGLLLTDVEEDYPCARNLDNALLDLGFVSMGRGIYQKKTQDTIRESYIAFKKSYLENLKKLNQLD